MKNKQVSLDILSLKNPPDEVINILMQNISKSNSIFEYWTWLWRNAIPLALNGYNVVVQDLNKDFLDILRKNYESIKYNNDECWKIFIEDYWNALDYELNNNYDVFICIRLLHFMQKKDAIKLIYKMQEHTYIWWYNVINFFIDKTIHNKDFFFPSVSEILEIYKYWTIIYESNIIESEITLTTNWRQMFQKSILFKK